jgi:RHS repeat-associated protein
LGWFASWCDDVGGWFGCVWFDRPTTGVTLARAANYDAFGKPSAGANTFDLRLGYHGELTFDSLTYLRHRDYDTARGQFTSPDPLDAQAGSTTAASRYPYAGNNPLSNSDPLGLSTVGDSLYGSVSDAWAEQHATFGDQVQINGKWVRKQTYNALQHNRATSESTEAFANLAEINQVGWNAINPAYHAVVSGAECASGNNDYTGVQISRAATCMKALSDAGQVVMAADAFAAGAITRELSKVATKSLLRLGADAIVEVGTKSLTELAKAGLAKIVDRVGNRGLQAGVDHIVLGLEEHGLRSTAESVGGRHLMDAADFRTELIQAVGSPTTRFSVSLDGFNGEGTLDQVMRAVKDGQLNGLENSFTNWELSILEKSGRLAEVTFLRAGKPVANPFVGGAS